MSMSQIILGTTRLILDVPQYYSVFSLFFFFYSSLSLLSTAVFPSLWTVTVPAKKKKRRVNERYRERRE